MDIVIKNLDPIAITAEHIHASLKGLPNRCYSNCVVHVPSVDEIKKSVSIDDLVTPFSDETYDGYRIGRIEDDIRGWHRYQEVWRNGGKARGGHLWDAKVSPLPIVLREFEKSINSAVQRSIASPVYYGVDTVNCSYDPDFYCQLLKDSMTLQPKTRLFPAFSLPDAKKMADIARDYFSVPWKSEPSFSGYEEIIESSEGFVLNAYGERSHRSYHKVFATPDDAIVDLVSLLLSLHALKSGSLFIFDPYVPSRGRSSEEIALVMSDYNQNNL